MFWNVRPTPSAAIACGGFPDDLRPSNTIEPEVGLYTPVSRLKNVVLPAPFGPISATIEPRGIVKSTSSVTAMRPPNSLRTCVATRRSSPVHQSSLRSVSVPSVCDVVERRVVHALLELDLVPPLGYQPRGGNSIIKR